jgi:AcrR family transcriptional regulator
VGPVTPGEAPREPGRRRPGRRLDPQIRQAQILDAARRLAATRDLTQVTTAEVAATAGVSQGLVFRYFPTRRDLELAVVRQATDSLLAALRTTPAGPAADRLRAGLVTYLDHVESEPESWRVLLRLRDDDEVARVLAEMDERNLGLLLETLGTELSLAPAALLTVLRAWLALEQRACLLWTDQPATQRAAGRQLLTDLLVETFTAALGVAAAADAETARLVAPLLPEPPAGTEPSSG